MKSNFIYSTTENSYYLRKEIDIAEQVLTKFFPLSILLNNSMNLKQFKQVQWSNGPAVLRLTSQTLAGDNTKKYGRIGFLQNKNRCVKCTKSGGWRSWERCRPPSRDQRAKHLKSLGFFV